MMDYLGLNPVHDEYWGFHTLPTKWGLASHWEASFLGGRPNHLATLGGLMGL